MNKSKLKNKNKDEKMRKLTEAKFNKIVSKTRMQPTTIEMARAVLVDGRSPTEVAKGNHATRQRVREVALIVYDLYCEDLGAPKGWVNLKAFFPEKRAKELIKESKDLLREYHKENK